MYTAALKACIIVDGTAVPAGERPLTASELLAVQMLNEDSSKWKYFQQQEGAKHVELDSNGDHDAVLDGLPAVEEHHGMAALPRDQVSSISDSDSSADEQDAAMRDRKRRRADGASLAVEKAKQTTLQMERELEVEKQKTRRLELEVETLRLQQIQAAGLPHHPAV